MLLIYKLLIFFIEIVLNPEVRSGPNIENKYTRISGTILRHYYPSLTSSTRLVPRHPMTEYRLRSS